MGEKRAADREGAWLLPSLICLSVSLGATCALIWPFTRDLSGLSKVGLGIFSALLLLMLCHAICRALRRGGLIPMRG